MAIAQATLSTKLQTEIIALYGAADNSARLKDFCDAIAKAVVDEIHANAEVNTVTSTPNAQGGVSILPGVGVGTIL